MKILLATGIFPPDAGGPATYTQRLSEQYRNNGHEVVVVTYSDDAQDAKAEERGSDAIVRISRRHAVVVRYLKYAWAVFKAARKTDVVYAQGPVSEGLPATIAAKLAGRPLVMKVVGDYAWEMNAQRASSVPFVPMDEFLQVRHSGRIGWYERIERWTARQARDVIVPSRFLKTVVERWGVPSERIRVMKNTVDTEHAARNTERHDLRKDLHLENKIVFLTAVRAVPWKGVSELIRWWPKLPQSHVLVVAGDGPELGRWKQEAEALGLQERVRFVGRLAKPDLYAWYAASDAFLLHSGYEGYSHVIAEAVSFGLPCFVSDMCGNPEAAEDFPGLVRVLPFRDGPLWTEALAAFVPTTDTPRPVPPVASWEQMADQTLKILRGDDAPTGVVMVSFERRLLTLGSPEQKRIESLAGGAYLRALVISSIPERDDLSCMSGALRVFAWRGGAVRRFWRAIVLGIREARRLPGRTIVTAQDPFGAGLVGYLISRWTNVPLELQEHADFYSGYWAKESLKNRVLSVLGRILLRRAERVRAVSERIKCNLIRIGVPESKIDVIPVSQTLPGGPCTQTVSDDPRIIAPCRFVRQKGLDVLLDAARQLREEGVRFRLDLIGKGPEEEALRALIAEYRLQDRVRIMPWADADGLWGGADLFVMSSRYEGWGRTIVEAMAAGVPIVTTDVGCAGSLFRPQIDGRVVQPEDAGALARAIKEQLSEHDRRIAMCESARKRSAEFLSESDLHERQRFGWQRIRASESRPGPRWDLWVLSFVAFAILSRLASALLFHDSLLNREWSFMVLVDHWFKGFGYSFALDEACRSAYRSPAYLFFLTALYAIFPPENTLAQALVQNAVVVGTLWLVYAVGRRLAGKRAALIGAFIMACYPYTFYHYTQYYHTFLSSFFLLLLVWNLLRLHESKKMRFAVGSGFGIAALAYVQGTILAATPFIAAWLAYAWWPDWKRAAKAVAMMAVVSVGLIAPWTYRNWVIFHEFVPLTTDLGFGYMKSNSENIYEITKAGYPQETQNMIVTSSTDPGYDRYIPVPSMAQNVPLVPSVLWSAWHPREPIWHPNNGRAPLQSCRELGPLNEHEFNQYWMEKARESRSRMSVSELVALHVQKAKTFWQPALFPSQKFGAAWSFADSAVKVWLARAAVTFASGVVIFGGFIGLVLHARRRDRLVLLPIVILLVYTVLHTFFAGYTKYRIPLDNLMAIYAGWTLVAIWDRVRATKRL